VVREVGLDGLAHHVLLTGAAMTIESDPGPVSKRVLFGTVLPGLAQIFSTHKTKFEAHEKRIAELEKRLMEAEERASSMKHQLERHRDHLSALETRTKRLERGA
jgi:predicted RNase H-like nuclease (RuvC/YqgF family)